MSKTSASRYKTANEILEHLGEIFHDDANRRTIIARRDLTRLRMRTRDDFNGFLAVYSRLAREAGAAIANRKLELFGKLVIPLQTMVARQAFDDRIDFLEFTKHCSDMWTR